MDYKDYRQKGLVAKGSGYKGLAEQLDLLWHDIDAGKLDKTGSWYLDVKAVKERFPKP